MDQADMVSKIVIVFWLCVLFGNRGLYVFWPHRPDLGGNMLSCSKCFQGFILIWLRALLSRGLCSFVGVVVWLTQCVL